MRHRRRRNALRKEGFSGAVSLRALIMRDPISGSSAHEGTRPHLSVSSRRLPPSATTAATDWVGATLKFGERSARTSSSPNSAANLSVGTVKVYLPHMFYSFGELSAVSFQLSASRLAESHSLPIFYRVMGLL